MYTLAGAAEFTGLYLGMGLATAFAVLAVGAYYVTKVIVDGIRKAHAAKLEAQAHENQDRLKSLMIQRGMSADEIERILRAEGAKADLTGGAETGEARIVEVLSGNGYNATDIENILRAARGDGDSIPPTVARLVESLAENWAKATDIERVLQSRRRPVTT